MSCATARIALPCLVDLTNHVSRMSTGTTMKKTDSLFHWITMSPILIASVLGMKFGTGTPRS